jgi:hypothetical protein
MRATFSGCSKKILADPAAFFPGSPGAAFWSIDPDGSYRAVDEKSTDTVPAVWIPQFP